MEKTVHTIEQSALIFKLLADKTRLTMVKLLESSDCCVCEFVEIFQMSQPAISQHLRKLRDGGIVKEERRGQWIFYSLQKESDFYPFVLHLLAEIPSQEEKLVELEANGNRITCC